MKRTLFIVLALVMSTIAFAQTKIQLRSTDKAECVKSDYTSLKASFSFSGLEAQKIETVRGAFSALNMPNTVIGGNEGEPQIPVINQLIAVPVGAQPRIEITSYSTTDYRLADYDMNPLIPRQPSLRKDKRPEDVPFVMNEAAYQSTRGLRSEPTAVVSVEGTMRGVQLGKMTIEPVSYDPVNNIIRVFNNIEVTVHFDGADAKATEQLLVDTYSPYFNIVYKSLFNGRAITTVYDDHPDLYSTPVKMLVVTTSTYANSSAFQNWLTWKKQKGFVVDIYTVTSSTSSSTIRSGIQSRYNANHPSFLVIVGDETVVPQYSLWDYDSYYGNAATDLEYASVDSDIYHDMFLSRMPVSSTTQLGYLVNKILMYEKYTMPDPSYLNETLLIAGWDEPQYSSYPSWTNIAGKPTIQYANNNYFNSAHGITPHVFITTGSDQTTCYNYINQVGFINYTAHGDIQEWSDPNFTNSQVNSLTNTNKPFWAMGNCCLTANFKNAQNNKTSFGEAMVRAQNKGAFGYIGSVVESYWYEDFYFGVGAFNASYSTNNNPTVSGTSKGVYDAMFDDTGFNTLNSVPYIGNLAVSYAYAKNYTNSSITPEYYWRCYQCFGDGSVMPYLKVPAANNVSHAETLPTGVTSFNISADAGSYVAITVNNEIIGVAVVPSNGTVDVPITEQTTTGTAMIVVTRNQRQPYITTIDIIQSVQYDVTVTANPSEGGTVSGAGSYYGNAECTLVATPNTPQYEFTNWKKGSNVVSTNTTYTFTVTESVSFTANFTALTAHNITCNAANNGTISADKTTAYKGETVTLTANGNDGYIVSSWNVLDDNNNPITVTNNQFTMPDSNVSVSATFSVGYVVTLASVMNGTISANPSSALPGTQINLVATPATGYFCNGWVVYKTGDVNTIVSVTDNSFIMPSYDVTVSAIFTMPTGDDVTVGSGTASHDYLPTNSYYNYTLTQQIYTPAEIGSAGRIIKVAFKVANSKSTTRNIDIYMDHTTTSAFSSNSSWITQTSSKRVFSGNVEFNANDWTTILLDTPFDYNGSSNLLLTVDDNSGTCVNSSSDSPKFYIYSTGANRALRYANDDNNANPTASLSSLTGRTVSANNQVVFTKGGASEEEYISLSLSNLSGFTNANNGQTPDIQSFSIVACITNDLTVTAPEHYEISQTPEGPYTNSIIIPVERTLDPEVITTNIYVRLIDGLEAGIYNEDITISSGETTRTVSLLGEVISVMHWVYDISQHSENMTVMAVIQIEGVEQRTTQLEVGGFSGDECRGTVKAEYCPPVDRYILPLLIGGSDNEEIAFRLYDHALDAESALTCNTTLAFNTEGYGSINNPVILNFTSTESSTITQTSVLQTGWNWWSAFIDLDGVDGIEMLKEQLGSSASIIKAHLDFLSYTDPDTNPNTGGWAGDLSTINNESCYLISIKEPVTIEMTGLPVITANHPITINNGWNWIGYPRSQAMSIADAFSNFTPEDGDMVKTQGDFCTYHNGVWTGPLNTLIPGQGYLYLSKSTTSKTLMFPSAK